MGVMGSGATSDHRAAELGRWLATLPVHLLTGGGAGTMEAVTRAFAEVPGRRGLTLGVIRGNPDGTPVEPPNPWVEIPILTHLPLSGERGTDPMSRNHINVLTSTVIVALPGGAGTSSEVRLARRYRRPLVAWLQHPAEIPQLPAGVPVETTLEGIQRFVLEHLALAGDPGESQERRSPRWSLRSSSSKTTPWTPP